VGTDVWFVLSLLTSMYNAHCSVTAISSRLWSGRNGLHKGLSKFRPNGLLRASDPASMPLSHGLLIYPEDGGSAFFRHIQDYTTSQLRRQFSRPW
jgi:hypothetical protein